MNRPVDTGGAVGRVVSGSFHGDGASGVITPWAFLPKWVTVVGGKVIAGHVHGVYGGEGYVSPWAMARAVEQGDD